MVEQVSADQDAIEGLLKCARGERLTNASFTWQSIKALADVIDCQQAQIKELQESLRLRLEDAVELQRKLDAMRLSPPPADAYSKPHAELLDMTRRLLRKMRDEHIEQNKLTGRTQREGDELLAHIDVWFSWMRETKPEPPTATPWVSIVDRMPDEWTLVLVYRPGPNQTHYIGQRYSHSNGRIMWELNGRTGYGTEPPTHWMPFPGLPETKAEPPAESRSATLFDAIAHGDEQHCVWLKQAIDHFAGRPVLRPDKASPTKTDAERSSTGKSPGHVTGDVGSTPIVQQPPETRASLSKCLKGFGDGIDPMCGFYPHCDCGKR